MIGETKNPNDNCSCDGSKGLTLDGEVSSSTYNECICNTSIFGISTPIPIVSLKIIKDLVFVIHLDTLVTILTILMMMIGAIYYTTLTS